MLHTLKPAPGSKKTRKRVGRGPGSGHGKTSCKGQNGQKSRAGGVKGPGFEGGQMPLQRRLPKKGFRNPDKIQFGLVKLGQLSVFDAGSQVTPETLSSKGIIRNERQPVKILAGGSIAVALKVSVQKISQTARRQVEEAGGTVEELA
jgi:large subunit ribosomal protein L15